jgi:uncharacterized protein (TIGR02466 family)
MEIRTLFPTPLIISQIDDGGALVTALKTAILAEESRSRGTQHSNLVGWQSNHNLEEWAGLGGEMFMAGVLGQMMKNTAIFEGGQLREVALNWKIQVWANVNRTGASNKIHYHPGAFWSGCFYVDDGGIDGHEHLGGAIEFHDPRGAMPMMYAPTIKMKIADCFTAGLSERIYPKTGMMLLFPSWLQHSVEAYTGNGTRISIAFNASV